MSSIVSVAYVHQAAVHYFLSYLREIVSHGRTTPSTLMIFFLCSFCDSESLIRVMSNISNYPKNFVMELIYPFIYSVRNSHLGVKYVILQKFVKLLYLVPCKIWAEVEYLKV